MRTDEPLKARARSWKASRLKQQKLLKQKALKKEVQTHLNKSIINIYLR